jgi:hypothetical protein
VGIWIAVADWLTGGIPYEGAKFKVSAHSVASLRKRLRRREHVEVDSPEP